MQTDNKGQDMKHKCNSKYFMCFQKFDNSPLQLLNISGNGCSECNTFQVKEYYEDVKYCPFCGYQPERSKREDHNLVYLDEKGDKTPIRDLFNPKYGCGALNTMET
jgi:hypothetical protein